MNANTQATPVVFNFTAQSVRVVVIDDAPWFVATDVAEALDYRNAPDMTRILDDDEKGTQIVRTPGGDQELTVINESGLYAAILKSRKPGAKKFKKWVTSEVLPAIRKTGSYHAAQQPVERYVDLTTHPDFINQARMIAFKFWFGGSANNQLWAALRKIGAARCTAFPESQIPRAREELARINERAEAFFKLKCDFEAAALEYVFGEAPEALEPPGMPTLYHPRQKALPLDKPYP